MNEDTDLSQFSLSIPPVRAAELSGGAIAIWFDIVSLLEDARTGVATDLNSTFVLSRPMTNSTLFGTIMPTEIRAAPPPPPTDPVGALRGRLYIKLEQLKTRLYAALPDVEAGCIFAAVVFYIDELMLRNANARGWQLLQQEMFDFTDGGERFFDLVDQRLAVAQTSPIVFEILYYLLLDHGKHKGFQGRHNGHVEAIAQYHRRLQERIQAPEVTPRKAPQRKNIEKHKLTQALRQHPVPTAVYYSVAVAAVLFLSLITVWLSDLPDLGASRTRAFSADVQGETSE